MTKVQRRAKAKRAGAKRRKASAVKAFMKKMNPGKKAPGAVRVKRLKGGGISITPLKRKNIAAGFYDDSGVFHPIRASYDYSGSLAGEKGGAAARGRYLYRRSKRK